MAQKKRIGEVLKEAGLIDDFQLEAALSHQRSWGGKLGAILVELGFAREEDIARTIAEKLRIPYVDLFEPPIPPAIIKLIKSDIAKKYTVIPARKDGETLLIAMADPLDIQALDDIRFITGKSIRPALAMESEIKDAIRKYYDGEEVLRRRNLPAFRQSGGSEPMEIIRGSEPSREAESAAAQDVSRQDEDGPLRREFSTIKLHFEALISLLIEKGLIGRDELIRMIDHKKIGL